MAKLSWSGSQMFPNKVRDSVFHSSSRIRLNGLILLGEPSPFAIYFSWFSPWRGRKRWKIHAIFGISPSIPRHFRHRYSRHFAVDFCHFTIYFFPEKSMARMAMIPPPLLPIIIWPNHAFDWTVPSVLHKYKCCILFKSVSFLKVHEQSECRYIWL